jgi:hypothetical protein
MAEESRHLDSFGIRPAFGGAEGLVVPIPATDDKAGMYYMPSSWWPGPAADTPWTFRAKRGARVDGIHVRGCRRQTVEYV